MAVQETGCDRVRVQALNGAAYGAITSPANVGDSAYAGTTQWLFVGGSHSGEIWTTEEVLEEYEDYSDGCTPPPEASFIIEEDLDFIITEDENFFIVE